MHSLALQETEREKEIVPRESGDEILMHAFKLNLKFNFGTIHQLSALAEMAKAVILFVISYA